MVMYLIMNGEAGTRPRHNIMWILDFSIRSEKDNALVKFAKRLLLLLILLLLSKNPWLFRLFTLVLPKFID